MLTVFSGVNFTAIALDSTAVFNHLTVTTHADTFRFVADGNTDAVIRLENDKDLLDLALFSGVTFSDLLIRDGRSGKIVVEFTNPAEGSTEKITLKQHDAAMTVADLTAEDLIFA